MTDLIDRLESASEGSRELDILIATAVGAKRVDGPWYARYSTSLDAALTLVPEGWTGSVDVPGDNNGAWLDPPAAPVIGHERVYAIGATSALALCIASLKAREA